MRLAQVGKAGRRVAGAPAGVLFFRRQHVAGGRIKAHADLVVTRPQIPLYVKLIADVHVVSFACLPAVDVHTGDGVKPVAAQQRAGSGQRLLIQHEAADIFIVFVHQPEGGLLVFTIERIGETAIAQQIRVDAAGYLRLMPVMFIQGTHAPRAVQREDIHRFVLTPRLRV